MEILEPSPGNHRMGRGRGGGEGLPANQERAAEWGWLDYLIIHFQGTTEVPALFQTMACGF